jgi:hypothetical protein
VATALAAIVGLVTLLWPDAPPRLKAKLDHFEADTNVRLSEFAARQRVADAGITPSRRLAVSHRSRQGGQAVMLLATHGGSRELPLLAGPPETPEDSGPGEGEEFPPDGTDDYLPESSVVDKTTKPSESDRPPSSSARATPRKQSPVPSSRPVIDKLRPVERVEKKLPLPEMFPDEARGACSSGRKVRCKKGSPGAVAIDALTGGGGVVAYAKALLKVLKNTRAVSLPSGATEPLGVTLSFDLELEGFKGRSVDVRWSLYDAGARERVPRDWLSNRRALAVRPEAAFDRPSAEFWVPLPKQRGPYFVRLSTYDDQGKRLAYADSKSFR